MFRYTLCLTGIVVFAFGRTAAHADNPDSLAYAVKRAEIVGEGLVDEEYADYLFAAAQLAAEGYYAEARELLVELFEDGAEEEEELWAEVEPVETGTKDEGGERQRGPLPAVREGPARLPGLRAEIGATYDRYAAELEEEDLFFDSLDAAREDTLADYTLDDRPLEGFARVTLDWEEPLPLVERITPSVYVANTRARGALVVESRAPGGLVRLDAEVRAEKRLGEAYGDSSDLVHGGVEAQLSTRSLPAPLYVSLPVGLEAARYRRERADYPSYRELYTRPSVGIESGDFSRGVELSAELVHRTHQPLYDTDNTRIVAPLLSGYAVGERYAAYADVRLRLEKLPNLDMPRSRREGGVELRLEAVVLPRLRLELSGRWRDEAETHVDQAVAVEDPPAGVPVEDTVSYRLDGMSGAVSPAVHLELSSSVTLTCGYSYERSAYPPKREHDGRELWWPVSFADSYDAHEPRVALVAGGRVFDMTAAVSYRLEETGENAFTENNTQISPSIELSWRPLPWLTIDGHGDFSRRWYGEETEDDVLAGISAGVRL